MSLLFAGGRERRESWGAPFAPLPLCRCFDTNKLIIILSVSSGKVGGLFCTVQDELSFGIRHGASTWLLF